MNWAISLILSTDTPEKLLHRVIVHIKDRTEVKKISLTDIDATGPLGNQLTKVLNEQPEVAITNAELLTLLTEDGQIFDLDIVLVGTLEYRLIISDGNYIDVLGTGEKLPESVTGLHEDLDLRLFFLP